MVKWLQTNFKYYLFHSLFHGYDIPNGIAKYKKPPTFDFIFTQGDATNVTDKHPIAVDYASMVIKGGIDLYITPELYARNKSIFKDLTEINPVDVTPSLLARFRNQLNDQDFLVEKIYGFNGKFLYATFSRMMISDVIIPDFNISIKINYKKKLMFLRKRLNQHFICWIINITNTTQKTTKTSTKNQRTRERKSHLKR